MALEELVSRKPTGLHVVAAAEHVAEPSDRAVVFRRNDGGIIILEIRHPHCRRYSITGKIAARFIIARTTAEITDNECWNIDIIAIKLIDGLF